jgi:hypothetical protein
MAIKEHRMKSECPVTMRILAYTTIVDIGYGFMLGQRLVGPCNGFGKVVDIQDNKVEVKFDGPFDSGTFWEDPKKILALKTGWYLVNPDEVLRDYRVCRKAVTQLMVEREELKMLLKANDEELNQMRSINVNIGEHEVFSPWEDEIEQDCEAVDCYSGL